MKTFHPLEKFIGKYKDIYINNTHTVIMIWYIYFNMNVFNKLKNMKKNPSELFITDTCTYPFY